MGPNKQDNHTLVFPGQGTLSTQSGRPSTRKPERVAMTYVMYLREPEQQQFACTIRHY
jgi:hypothetical protein